jgi:N6-adenosine-specific RNA methylase IME4
MPLSEIVAIRPRMAKQAHLYVWGINAHLDWAYRLIEAWGGEPITVFTWKKPGLGTGRFMCNTEHIIVGRVGNRMGNPFGKGGRVAMATPGTLFEWPRGKHSEKPAEMYSLVESLSPAPRLDMYARKHREGWATWGDEIAPEQATEP